MLKKIARFICELMRRHQDACRFIAYDFLKNEATFQIKMKSSVFKVPLQEAVFDFDLLTMLSPQEACFLGGYHGRYYRSMPQHNAMTDDTSQKEFFLKKTDAQYQLLSLARNNRLTYWDSINKKIYTDYLFVLVNNNRRINKFDSVQACYIGFLAGIFFEKIIQLDKQVGNKKMSIPVLRIVN